MSKLSGLSHYPQTENEKKQRNTYSLYARPIIFWSLQCELEGENSITRHDALQVFSNAGISMAVPISLIVIASFYGLVNILIAITNFLRVNKDVMEILETANIRSFVMLVIGLSSLCLFYHGRSLSQKELASIESLSTLSQCSDA